ncbi:MAG: imidazolonepropionase [Bacteroidota bacterium]
MRTLFIHIKQLLQVHEQLPAVVKGLEMNQVPSIKNAFLLIEDDKILQYGSMNDHLPSADEIVDVSGKIIFPTWCDSHTHIVFAATREEEFLMKIEGKSYEEIAAAGGGILNSARKVEAATEEELFMSASNRLNQLIRLGTGSIEIKSGYGLSTDAELKMLRVIKKLKEHFPIPIKATFLGAHAYPSIYKENHEAYIQLIIEEMLPRIQQEQLADYIDVFCEEGFFSTTDTGRILTAAASYGLAPKIHANQLNVSGGVQVGIAHQAISVDHLECMDEAAIQALKGSHTIATLLPSCSFYLGIPFAPARTLMQENIPVALASDYNPGSTPSGNMNFLFSLACIKLKMKPMEALNAMTINGAYAMQVSDSVGSITVGKKANFIITKEIPSITYLAYSFGENCIDNVYINGNLIV